jgi:hypothetical protein
MSFRLMVDPVVMGRRRAPLPPLRNDGSVVLGMEPARSPKPLGKRGVSEGFSTAGLAGNPLLERVCRCRASESHPGGRRFESG